VIPSMISKVDDWVAAHVIAVYDNNVVGCLGFLPGNLRILALNAKKTRSTKERKKKKKGAL